MHAIKMTLILTLGVLTPHAFATIVPVTDEVVEANLKSEGGVHFLDGYIQLNKSRKSISLVLQPVMPPCPEDVCTEVMPAPFEYFMEQVSIEVDACDAVIYRAVQSSDHEVKVTVIDNTQYNYERCPTFLPVPETVVQLEQKFINSSSTEQRDEYFAGTVLANVRY